MIIGLMGYPEAGKDEIAKALQALEWKRVAFADPVRAGYLAQNPWVFVSHEASAQLYEASGGPFPLIEDQWLRVSTIINLVGWDLAKKIVQEIRDGLRLYGTEGGRDIHGQNCWLNIARGKIDEFYFAGKNIVVTDVRFENEVNFMRGLEGICPVKLVHVNRPGSTTKSDHISDQLDYSKYADATITSGGSVEELHKSAVQLVRSL